MIQTYIYQEIVKCQLLWFINNYEYIIVLKIIVFLEGSDMKDYGYSKYSGSPTTLNDDDLLTGRA